MPDCTSNAKPLCVSGIQTRFEAGRGIVELPCPLCREEEFLRWANEWKAAPKPEVKPAQAAMFEKGTEYPG